MSPKTYTYSFGKSIDVVEAEATLLLSLLAVEALHGECEFRMNARHAFYPKTRSCEIDASSEIGRDLNRIYVGFMTREFGSSSFSVHKNHQSLSSAA